LGNGNDVFIPLSYAPGQMAQVDFGEAEVIIGTVYFARDLSLR
jgi:hypothetical protein